MSKEIGRYDSSLQMFVEAPRQINTNRLLFERWLVQNGLGEHLPESRPLGETALALVIKEGQKMETMLSTKPRRIIVPED